MVWQTNGQLDKITKLKSFAYLMMVSQQKIFVVLYQKILEFYKNSNSLIL